MPNTESDFPICPENVAFAIMLLGNLVLHFSVVVVGFETAQLLIRFLL